MSFLDRWSRRKLEVLREKGEAKEKPAASEKAPAPVKAEDLPSVESLTFDSDFGAFLRANIDERVKRAALKKLLHDPRFNVMDGLDVYIDDYTKNDPIPEEMLKTLEHARSTLFGPQPAASETGEGTATETAEATPEPTSEAASPMAQDRARAAEDSPPDSNGHPRQDA